MSKTEFSLGVDKVSIPERTEFHAWYEEMFKEEMTMTYSEIYTAVCKGNNFMLNEIIKMFSHEQEEKYKKMFNSPMGEIMFLENEM